jgi:hypothetical protein
VQPSLASDKTPMTTVNSPLKPLLELSALHGDTSP